MLGLLAGVAGVVLIAVMYYQKNTTQAATPSPTPNAAPIKPVANYPTPAATPAAAVR